VVRTPIFPAQAPAVDPPPRSLTHLPRPLAPRLRAATSIHPSMYKAANARLLLRSLSPNSAALASVNPGRAASSARLALSLPCGAWVGRSGLVRRAAAFSGTRPRFAGARAQIGAAVPAVEQFQRRMATQGACARALVFVRPRVGSSVWSWVVCLSRARGAGRSG
jgi:hypothetical protein